MRSNYSTIKTMVLINIFICAILGKFFQLATANEYDMQIEQNHLHLKTIGFTRLFYDYVASSDKLSQKVSSDCLSSFKNVIKNETIMKNSKLQLLISRGPF